MTGHCSFPPDLEKLSLVQFDFGPPLVFFHCYCVAVIALFPRHFRATPAPILLRPGGARQAVVSALPWGLDDSRYSLTTALPVPRSGET